MTIDDSKLNALLGKFVGDFGAALHATTVIIGEKLGLYKALAGAGRVPDRRVDVQGRAEDHGGVPHRQRRGVARASSRSVSRHGAVPSRLNIRKRLLDAITRIGEHSPPLGKHLEQAVKTGTFCSYRPARRLA